MLSMILLAACQLRLAAASDLAPLKGALSARFEAASGCRVAWSFASSGSLARQIEQGAGYDLYFSANREYVDRLATAGKVRASSIVTYGLGRLAIWSKKGYSWADLEKPEVRFISIANPAHAPYGLAAKEALERRGLWLKTAGKIVYAGSVREAVQYADTGNADVTIASWTLLRGRGELLDAGWHSPIRQTAAVVAASSNKDAALRILRYLSSEEGQAVLAAHGLAKP